MIWELAQLMADFSLLSYCGHGLAPVSTSFDHYLLEFKTDGYGYVIHVVFA